MKKALFRLCIVCLAITSALFVFTACEKPHVHSYTEQVTAPTCTEQGYTTHTCTRCGETKVDTYVGATGHSFTNYVSDGNATFESDGTKTAICDNGCGATDTVTDTGSKKQSEFSFKTLEVDGDTAYGKTPNTQTLFDFNTEVEIKGVYTYSVTQDEYGLNPYLSKKVPLTIGDNVYYVFVLNHGDVIKTYVVTIHRIDVFEVTFNTLGGTEIETQHVEEGSFATQPTAPIKTGYTFSGWDFDFATPITQATVITVNWSANKNSIIFNANGGSGEMSTQILETGATAKLNANAFTRDGYLFDGWATSSTGSVVYANEANYTMGTNSSYTLYAVWGSAFVIENNVLVSVKEVAKTERSLIILNDVKNIGARAFENIKALEEITIPNSVTSIGERAFSGCSGLTSVTISDSVTSIGNYAFSSCSSLTSITIPDSVTSIGDNAFRDCNKLVEVINKSGLNITKGSDSYGSVGYYALYVHNEATKIVNKNDCLFITDESGTNYLFDYVGNESELTLPNDYNGQTYEIYKYAFRGCSSLTSVTIGDSVTSIGDEAFSGCSSLQEMTIPFVGGSIKTENDTYQYPFGYIFGTSSYTGGTGTRQYYYGSSTSSTTNTTYYIPSSLRKVTITGGNILCGAFSDCSGLTSITIGDSVTSIGNSAFYSCIGLTSVTIPDSVTSIDYYAFGGCSKLTSITIPNSVTSIGDSAFSGCIKLVEVINKSDLNITKGSTDNGYVGYYALYIHNGESKIVNQNDYLFITAENGTNYLLVYVGSKTGLTLPNDYNRQSYEIYKYAFYDFSSLTSVTIGDSVTSIGDWAFYNCSSLTSITIGNSVTSIGYYAFEYCSSLTSITIPDSVTSIGERAFYDCPIHYAKIPAIACSYISKSALKTVEITSGDSIGSQVFYSCSSLTSIIIPDSVTSIGDETFSGCSGLTSVTIGNSVTSIGIGAFCRCSKLTSITIPNSVTSIGDGAFEGCSSLTSITIPDSVTGIGYYAFEYCSSLTSITIPNSVTSIGEYAFDNCSSLTSITIPNSVTSIGEYAFDNCSSLTSIIIPNSVTSIGSYAFYNCSSLTSVTIGNSVTSIGSDAFFNCSGLTSVTIPDSVTSIGSYAFYNCSSLTSITFSDTTTWYRTNNSTNWQNKSGGTETNVTSPSIDAMYFKSMYYNYYWYKK